MFRNATPIRLSILLLLVLVLVLVLVIPPTPLQAATTTPTTPARKSRHLRRPIHRRAELQKQLEDAKAKVAQLQKQLDDARNTHGDEYGIKKQLDAANADLGRITFQMGQIAGPAPKPKWLDKFQIEAPEPIAVPPP